MERFLGIASAEKLRAWKKVVLTSWEIELTPGNPIPYYEGVVKHPGQSDMHLTPWQYYVAPWGRRTGKTFAAAAEIIYTASLPDTKTWIVAPTYELTDRVFELVYKALVIKEIFGPGSVKSAHFTTNSRYILMTNGSEIKGKSAESPKSLKGEQLDLIVIDECAFVAEDIWTEYLEPCTLDRKGRAIFISTPRGHNWFKTYFDRRLKEETKAGGWAGIHCKSADNPYMDLEWLESKRRQTPEDIFRREYEASFEHFTGLIYPMFRNRFVDFKDPHLGGHIYDPKVVATPSQLTRYRAIDIGWRHPTCCLWSGVDFRGDVWIYREYHGQASTVHENHAKTIRSKTGRERVFDTFISHDSRRRFGQSEDNNDSVQELYAQNGIYTNLANTDVSAGITSVASYLQATVRPNSSHPKVYISKQCPHLIDGLGGYIWADARVKEIAAPERPRKWNDDDVDTFRYLLHGNPSWVDPKDREPGMEAMLTDENMRYGYQQTRRASLQKNHARRTRGHRIVGLS